MVFIHSAARRIMEHRQRGSKGFLRALRVVWVGLRSAYASGSVFLGAFFLDREQKLFKQSPFAFPQFIALSPVTLIVQIFCHFINSFRFFFLRYCVQLNV